MDESEKCDDIGKNLLAWFITLIILTISILIGKFVANNGCTKLIESFNWLLYVGSFTHNAIVYFDNVESCKQSMGSILFCLIVDFIMLSLLILLLIIKRFE